MSEKSSIRRAIRRLPVIRDQIDTAYHVVRVENDLGMKVACKKGCAHCCSQMVTVTMPEAIGIYLSIADNRWLLGNVAHWADTQATLIMRGMTSRQWFRTGQRCMFLTEDNSCAVYQERPFVCRTLMALETADNCAPDATDPTVKRPDYTRAFDHYLNTIKAADEAALPVGMIPLPIAMQWASIAWIEGRESLRRHLDRAGIPAYDLLAHTTFWSVKLGEMEQG